jgi:hypothetical protein
MNLTEEETNELITVIANDIYKRATWLQIMQLVQTQCSQQAKQIVENASDEEIEGFMKNIAESQAAADKAAAEENSTETAKTSG